MKKKSYQTVTSEILKAGLSDNGGYNYKQVKLFNIPLPCSPWEFKKRVLGRKVSPQKIKKFLALKDQHLMDDSRWINEIFGDRINF